MKTYTNYAEWQQACENLAHEAGSSYNIIRGPRGATAQMANGARTTVIGSWEDQGSTGTGKIFEPQKDNFKSGPKHA
jgi:hypothetical protein